MFGNNTLKEVGSRTILVTGGNRGIGLAIVSEMARNTNDTVLLGSRSLSDGRREAGKLPDNVHAVELDLGQAPTTEGHIRDILSEYGDIDVLVNNAGVLFNERFQDLRRSAGRGGQSNIGIGNATFDTAFQVNTFAPILLIRAVLPGMLAKGYGRIVNLSSGWGAISDGLTGPFTYALTKAALNAATLRISQELPRNVKINAMCPGWVRTRMGGAGAGRSPQKGAETAVWLANLGAQGPSGKFFRDMKAIPW